MGPADDQYGQAHITFRVNDGIDETTHQFILQVLSVNDAPSWSVIGDVDVPEDAAVAGAGYTVEVTESGSRVTHSGWATNVNAGPANDYKDGTVDQAQSLVLDFGQLTNADLFSVAPTIAETTEGTWDLTYTLAHNAYGTSVVTV